MMLFIFCVGLTSPNADERSEVKEKPTLPVKPRKPKPSGKLLAHLHLPEKMMLYNHALIKVILNAFCFLTIFGKKIDRM